MSADDENDREPMAIPAFIGSMLEPYVNIMGGAPNARKRQLELTLLPEHSGPSDQQILAIGKVCTAYSILERVMAIAIARLALAPEYPSLAITKELSANSQIKVLRVLIPLHEERYGTQIANRAMVESLSDLPKKIQLLNERRNAVVHTVWLKGAGEELLAMRSRPVNESTATANPITSITLSGLNALAAEIKQMADQLYLLVQLLPSVDEAQHAQALARSVPSLHREILPERQPPPESSGE